MPDGLYDCPKCGKAQSAWGDHFCGACEAEYHEQEERWKQAEIDRLKREMDTCPCRGDEPCQTCYRRLAQTLSLQGREAEAEYWLNH